jgi:hypothetical protein
MVLQVYKTLEPAIEVVRQWWKQCKYAPNSSSYNGDNPHCLWHPTHRPPIIAGGSIVKAFLGLEVSANTKTDFDIYFTDREIFDDFGDYLVAGGFTKNDGKDYPNSIRDSYKNDSIMLDVILVEGIVFEHGDGYNTRNRQIAERLFERFDLDVCKVAVVFDNGRNPIYDDTPCGYERLEPKLVYYNADEFIEQLNGKPMTFKVYFPDHSIDWEDSVSKTLKRLDKYQKLGLTKPKKVEEPYYIYYIEHLERKLKEFK